MTDFHTPVMLSQCVGYLQPQAGGVYVDATLGGGGHTLGLLKQCKDIRVFGFDQDQEALAEAKKKLSDYEGQLELINANFSRLRTELALRKVKSIDGILFDLGVSSHQLNKYERGFSFDHEAPLDMRMDRSIDYTAYEAVNELSQAELARIFREYGEDLNAGRFASRILKERGTKKLETTSDLARVIESVAGKGTRESLKSKVRIFQALRIHVNGELEVLEPALRDAINLLSIGGRIVVMSYHSLEDRIAKKVFKEAAEGCVCPPRAMQCICGGHKQLTLLTKKPLEASDEEILSNIRSRSVKLRAAEKIMGES